MMGRIAGTHYTWEQAATRSGYHTIPRVLRGAVERQARQMEVLSARLNHVRAAKGLQPTHVRPLSWVRSYSKNRAVGGARFSRHLRGDACDIAETEIDRVCPFHGGRAAFDRIANEVFRRGGFGRYPAGNRHVDSRGYRARWR